MGRSLRSLATATCVALFLLASTVPTLADCPDTDGDGICDDDDVCPMTPDPGQSDSDSDGVGDACEWCSDPDGDGVCDVPSIAAGDHCPVAYNPDPSGRKLVLTGSPFDGLEVTGSYLRRAGDDAPLVVYHGDLAVDGTPDLFTQRPLEALELTSLGAAAAAGTSGYTIEGIYETLALFLDTEPILPLHGVAFEGGTPPNRLDPLPAGYQISRRGTKIIFPWTSATFPCEFSWFYPHFGTIETTTGNGACFGVDFADQTIADWKLSSDRSWVVYLFKDFNSSTGAAVDASHLDFVGSGVLQAASLPGDIGSAPNVDVRDDGLALTHDYMDWTSFISSVVSLRVGSSVRTLSTGDEFGPTTHFSNEGDKVAVLHPYVDSGFVKKLLVGSLVSGPTLTIEDPSVDSINATRFAPGESRFAFTSVASTALYVAPVVEGGPVTQVATAGNIIGEFGFTPDGTTMLYTEERSSDQALELWAVAASGGTPISIGPVPGAAAAGVTGWTFADGRLVVYGSFDGVTSQLYSMETDGSDLQQVVLPGPSDSVADHWVCDGGIVLKLEGSSQLRLAPAGGGAAGALTLPGIEDEVSDPQVAEDGSFLIYDARIVGADRETVIYFVVPPDQDSDGILNPCDCLPADPEAGQSPGLVELTFANKSMLSWGLDGFSLAWTIYRGDLALVPGDEGTCLTEGHDTPSYVDTDAPTTGGEAYTYLVSGEGACGLGEVGPRSDGSSRNVVCP